MSPGPLEQNVVAGAWRRLTNVLAYRNRLAVPVGYDVILARSPIVLF